MSKGSGRLYGCAGNGRGFFVKVGTEQDKPVGLRSFVRAEPPEDYNHDMRLPEF